jgi:hypothetical protein
MFLDMDFKLAQNVERNKKESKASVMHVCEKLLFKNELERDLK